MKLIVCVQYKNAELNSEMIETDTAKLQSQKRILQTDIKDAAA